MWKWIKKHKAVTALVIVLIIGAAVFFYLRYAAQQAMAALAEMSEETAFVERRSIQSSISSTGRIMSDSTKAVTATLTGVEVLTLHVEVGDVVQAGDVICTFDTEDIAESLVEAQDILSAAEIQSDVSVDGARRGLEMAVETQNYQIETAARTVLNAHNAWGTAAEAYDNLQERISQASSALSGAQANLSAAQAGYNASKELAEVTSAQAKLKEMQEAAMAAQAEVDTAQAAVDALKAADPAADFAELAAAETALAAAEAGLASANADTAAAEAGLAAAQTALADSSAAKALSTAQTALSTAQNAYDTLEGSRITSENSLRSAQIAYDNAVAAYDYTVAAQQSQYEGSEDSLKSAKAGASVATISQENAVEAYQEQLDKGVLKASIPGTITQVNVEEGDMYAGGAVVTIQDFDELVVSAEIDEYDIADVKLGMKAVFKTDSTRDEQLEGRVIFISPTPTAGSDVTYQVKVAIDSDKSRLRLGMNAKLNIILEETGNVLTVPYDAVQKDDSGNDVVYSVERSEDGTVTKTAIPVTVGVEGDYYVEVEGAITEGMEVSMPSDEVDFMARMEEMRENMMG